MDALNKWFDSYVNTPAGGVLVFLLVFVSRLALDRWSRKAESKHKKRRKEA